jgi:hypothetical protein
MTVRLGVAALLLGVAACGGAAASFAPNDTGNRLGAWVPDSSATILHTSVSQLDDPTLSVVSTSAAWVSLWTQAWGGGQAVPPLPSVDFVLSSVIVVGLGKRAGPGYSVTIDSVVLHTVGAVLFATESQAGTNCAPLIGTSAAVHMVRAPGHFPVIDWQVSSIRQDCAP